MANGTLTLIACDVSLSHARLTQGRHDPRVAFPRTIMRVRKRLLWPLSLSENSLMVIKIGYLFRILCPILINNSHLLHQLCTFVGSNEMHGSRVSTV
jgi:hypothetical protein